MVERALELAMKQAQGAEVSLGRKGTVSAKYSDDKLKEANIKQVSSLGVKVIHNGKIGYASTTDLDDIEGVVARAIELAEFGNEAKHEFPGPADAKSVATFDQAIADITLDELVSVSGNMLEQVKEYNPEIKVSADAHRIIDEWHMVNSGGMDISLQISDYEAGVFGTLIRDTDMLEAGYYFGWRKKKIDPLLLAQQAIYRFRLAERNVGIDSKPMPVIFTPMAYDVLLMPIKAGINGKAVLKGDSPLAGRLGEKIVSDKLSLIDDGTIDYAPDSSSYDWEGVPRRRMEIIKDGVINAFLYDLQTAGEAGVSSTGHGGGCTPSNLIIPAGNTPLEEIVRNTKEGMIVDQVMGAGQSNVINGDFSVNVALGYKIENGEIVGRVKNVMLAGNVYDALKDIDALSQETEWVGSTSSPYIKLAQLSVVAKE